MADQNDTALLAYQWSTGCHALHYPVPTIYGYSPSLAAGIIFVTLFALTMIVHVAQTVMARRWWTLVFGVGALTETLGWAARTWSMYCPYNTSAFLMQLATLVFAPTRLTAGLYWILGILIRRFGPHTSPISSYAYLWIFCSCDLLSLLIQAADGGIASGAISEFPPANPVRGTDVMVAGIVFQLASILVFAVFFFIFIQRSRGSEEYTTDVKFQIAATAFTVMLVLARGVYRSIELAQGWTGYLINHQVYFIALDGSLMAVSFITYNLFHPAWLLEKGATNGQVTSGLDSPATENNREFIPLFPGDKSVAAMHSSKHQ